MSNKDGFTIEQWISAKAVSFDSTDDYMREVDPIVQQLRAKCEQFGIPFSFVAAHADNEKKTAFAQANHFPDVSKAPFELLLARISLHSDDAGIYKAYFVANAMKQLDIEPPVRTPAKFDA